MSGSRPRLCLCLALFVGGCHSVDPDVFDERLRAATFDRYVDEIDLQLAVDRPELAAGALSARFRARAVAADTPWRFQRVLLDMLLLLRDPHVDLSLSTRRWNVTDLGRVEAVVDAVPCPREVVRADGVLHLAHRPAVAAAGDSLAARLVASAGDPTEPLTWQRIVALDGQPIADRIDVELLRRGPLLAPVIADVVDGSGATRRLELPRNGLLGTDELGRSVIVPPVLIAEQMCDPPLTVADGSAGDGVATATARPALVVSVASPAAPRFRAVTMLRRTTGWRADQQIDAWRLGAVGYLRLGAFPLTNEQAPPFRAAVGEVIARLLDCDTLVVDLLDNHGGDWVSMCQVASHFLPRTDEWVPHVGRRRTRTDYWFVHFIEDTTHRILRDDVPPLAARRIVVLVDQDTASAAEILAAILRARRQATLIGERTVGAETWVHSVDGPDGSRLSFGLPGGMTAGAHFQGRGLEPDVAIELSLRELEQHGAELAQRRLRRAIRAAALAAAGLAPDEVIEPVGDGGGADRGADRH